MIAPAIYQEEEEEKKKKKKKSFSKMSSLDTTMEDEDYFFDSDTDAIIFGTSDHSGWGGDSMISDPNIVSSPSTSADDYQQQISTAAGCGGDDDDLMIVSSAGASSSRLMNNNKQSEIRIFNVDFRALSSGAVLSSPSCQLPQNNFPEFCIQREEKNQDEQNDAREIKNSTSVYDVAAGLCGWPSSRIVSVSRAPEGKDRHSKVVTFRGIRDTRVRLSVYEAIQFYDLQDRLGYDQPSKAVKWLLKAAAPFISELPPLPAPTSSQHLLSEIN